MEPQDFQIQTMPIDPRSRASRAVIREPKFELIDKRNTKGDFRIIQQFIPDGWRVLRPREEVEEGDYRWKKTGVTIGYYVPATKIGDMVGFPVVYIRRK